MPQLLPDKVFTLTYCYSVHILPELSKAQETIQRVVGKTLAFLEHHVYLMVLLGLVVFYGLERMAKRWR
ncbi:hypothetical protein H6G17_20100 [Chroococcidiopsis sp. FACHB-1243]|nr:hypothetical protein [Chroococcidiopsis sp. [FACHB-1243]]MBD2307775.1 hypothetical protein [Chroococcidiopsis sp. [FACHB-1243]]